MGSINRGDDEVNIFQHIVTGWPWKGFDDGGGHNPAVALQRRGNYVGLGTAHICIASACLSGDVDVFEYITINEH